MAIPLTPNLELPLLKAINDAGGNLDVLGASESVASCYPELTAEDKASRLNSGGNRWVNRVQWARQNLVLKGDLDGTVRGQWQITAKGKARLAREWASWKPEYSTRLAASTREAHHREVTEDRETTSPETKDPYEDLDVAWEDVRKHVERELLEKVKTISPSLFEILVGQLLDRLGYSSIQVTGRSGDGGIDGECCIDSLGLYKVLFQAKRWSSQVGAPDVRGFIGALHTHRVNQGIFITTSTFSDNARDESNRSGNVKLIDGMQLAVQMVRAGLGFRKTNLEVPKIDNDYFEGLV